ncbi:membrane-associated protein [Microbacterium sp. SORGH_AS 505]|uniref:DedA family protein n=1 Tax=Microbacterium sp. SORGH_AS_0505 TaxID=3041770 RepID=UPI002784DC62|nr:VTT domain-containing protein [Microbacterium sp. SORGH_AS_0505]MDQ1126887.1 membrane-associated protein [Microbacterium sp. SORGH_AS_0505]
MIGDLLTSVASSPWALPALFALVFADAVLVIVPGEVAVTATGALAAATGSPPLVAVVIVAAVAAFCGDALCYGIGRVAGVDRWRWMRHPRVRSAFAWAGARLAQGTATVVFTARFIPFARLAVNLTAGATRVPPGRYVVAVAVAATAWAVYQAVIGAAIGTLLPDNPIVAVIASIVVAIALGLVIDVAAARLAGRRTR